MSQVFPPPEGRGFSPAETAPSPVLRTALSPAWAGERDGVRGKARQYGGAEAPPFRRWKNLTHLHQVLDFKISSGLPEPMGRGKVTLL